MANRSHLVTRVPVDLKTIAGLTLVVGTTYIVQNRGIDTLYWAEAAAAPDPATEDISFTVGPGQFASMPVKADPIWAWVLGSDASLRVNEAS